LASVASLFANGIEHQGPAGDGFGMLIGVSQTHKQAPPVVNQGNDARHKAATFEVLGRKAAPAPVIFQFVEVVFGIGAVPIQLGNAESFLVQGGYRRGRYESAPARVRTGCDAIASKAPVRCAVLGGHLFAALHVDTL